MRSSPPWLLLLLIILCGPHSAVAELRTLVIDTPLAKPELENQPIILMPLEGGTSHHILRPAKWDPSTTQLTYKVPSELQGHHYVLIDGGSHGFTTWAWAEKVTLSEQTSYELRLPDKFARLTFEVDEALLDLHPRTSYNLTLYKISPETGICFDFWCYTHSKVDLAEESFVLPFCEPGRYLVQVQTGAQQCGARSGTAIARKGFEVTEDFILPAAFILGDQTNFEAPGINIHLGLEEQKNVGVIHLEFKGLASKARFYNSQGHLVSEHSDE